MKNRIFPKREETLPHHTHGKTHHTPLSIYYMYIRVQRRVKKKIVRTRKGGKKCALLSNGVISYEQTGRWRENSRILLYYTDFEWVEKPKTATSALYSFFGSFYYNVNELPNIRKDWWICELDSSAKAPGTICMQTENL